MEPNKKTDGMTSIKTSELQEIIAINRRLLEQIGEPMKKPAEIKERTVTVFFINNEPVIGYANKGSDSKPIYIYEKPDANRPGEYIPFINVITRNHPEPYVLNYNEFMGECARQVCKVKKMDWKEWIIDNGEKVAARSFQEGSYNMVESGAVVPVEVKGKTAIATVLLPDGTECDIHEKYLNINK